MSATASTPSTTSRSVAPGVADNPHHNRRWAILVVLALAQLIVVLDSTVVNIALPTAQRALGFSDGDRQWIVTAYALAFGSLLLLGGRLADRLGRKRIFLIGLAGFAVASAVGGAANGFGMLVASRAVQGAFGALLAPAGLALLTTTFTDAKERARAFGVYGAIGGGGAAIGLLLGGALTEYLSWRWCMYVSVVFAGLALVGGSALLRNQASEEREPLDIPGIVTVSAGLFSIVYGFSHAETAGWADAVTLVFLAAGVALLAVFVYLQSVVAHPVLPLRVLADRNRSGAYLAILITGAGVFGVFLFLTYYLQGSLGYSAVSTGVAFLPLVGTLVVTSIVGNTSLSTRIGPRWLVGPGLALSAVGLVLLTGISPTSTYAAHILPGLIVLGMGMGLIFASAISVATLGVAADDAGVASALVNTGQQVGGSVGTALLNTMAATAVAHYLAARGKATPAVVEHAQIHGYVTAFWWSAAIFAAGAVICGLMLRGEVPEFDPDAELLAAL